MKNVSVLLILIWGAAPCLAQDTSKKKPAEIARPMNLLKNFDNYNQSKESTTEKTDYDYEQLKKIDYQKPNVQNAVGLEMAPVQIAVPLQHNAAQLQAIQTQKAVVRAQFEVHAPAEVSKLVVSVSPDELAPNARILNGPSQFDSRAEVRSLNPQTPWVKGVLKNAYSVAVIVDKSKLRKISPTFYQIDDSNTLGALYQLCPGEAFREQPVVGTGTAMVTGSRQMVTAGHVFVADITQYVVIFGFEILNKTGAYQKIIPADSIYFPQQITRRSAELDIAIFSVDRDIRAQPLKLSVANKPAIGDNVYMLGFPYGLPKKIAANAGVTNTSDVFSFYTSLDAFEGNSGSPVFNLKTNEVIGILVSGGIDYRWNGGCNISNDCSIPYCQGEKAVSIRAVRDLLQ